MREKCPYCSERVESLQKHLRKSGKCRRIGRLLAFPEDKRATLANMEVSER
jgi:hypothetical protein